MITLKEFIAQNEKDNGAIGDLVRMISVPFPTIEHKGWGGANCIHSKTCDAKLGELFAYHKSDDRMKYLSFNVETVKILYIQKDKKLSLHFHVKKTELFSMVEGSLEIKLIWNGKEHEFLLEKGNQILVRPGLVHQMKGVSDNNILLEVSTLDNPSDSYRIIKGD